MPRLHRNLILTLKVFLFFCMGGLASLTWGITSTTGNFNLNISLGYDTIKEYKDNAFQANVPHGVNQQSIPLTRPDGNYRYDFFDDYIYCVYPGVCITGSTFLVSINVTVNIPIPSTPTTPSGPSTNYTGSYSVNWGNVSGATSYQLQEKLNSGSWSTIYNTNGTSTSRNGRSAGTWKYRVRACHNLSGCSSWSGTKSVSVTVPATPGTPSSSEGTSYDGSYTVSWSTQAGSTSYQLQERLNSGSWSTVYNASGISKARSGLSGGSWSYRARACNVIGCSSWSGTKTVSVSVPGVPSTPNGSETTSYDGSYSINWGAKTGATSYQLQEKLNSGSWSTIYNASGTSKSRSGRSAGAWYYKVRACGVIGCSGWSGTESISVSAPAVPATPSSSESTSYDGTYTISWGGQTGAANYQLQEKLNINTWSTVHDGSGISKGRSNQDSGTWSYRVRSCSAVGCSAWSATKAVEVDFLESSLPIPVPTSNDPVINENQTGVGRTPGFHSVTQTGDATYRIPINTPAGVNGIEPKLAFSYSSKAENGEMGFGWEVTGLSMISRCPRVYAFYGSNAPIHFGAQNPLCLDGKYLAQLGGTDGYAGATYETALREFSRITATGTPGSLLDGFIIEAKNGLTFEYGTTVDSKIIAVNSGGSVTPPHVWLLAKVKDRSGNEMSITYENDGLPTGGFRPSQILYTSNSSAGVAAVHKVEYVWEPRPVADQPNHSAYGGEVTQTKRLDRLDIQHNDGAGFNTIKTYELSYDYSSSGVSRVRQVQECDGAGICFHPSDINWTSGSTPLLVDNIVDGFDQSVQFTYATPSDTTVFTLGEQAHNPWYGLGNSPEYYPPYSPEGVLVKQVTLLDGNGVAYTKSYHYNDARQDLRGSLGFLGFVSRTEIDSRSGIKQTWNYYSSPPISWVSLSFPYHGKVVYHKVEQQNGMLIEETSTTYNTLQDTWAYRYTALGGFYVYLNYRGFKSEVHHLTR